MAAKGSSSRLFAYGLLDIRDDIDERLEKCHREISQLTSNLRESDTYEHLNKKVCRSVQDHEDTTLALLYSILSDPTNAPKSYSTLALLTGTRDAMTGTRDTMTLSIHIAELLILEKYPKLLEITRMQLVWLAREMIQTGVVGADRLCFAFLKQMPAGSNDPQDIWLSESLVHLFLDNRQWLDSQPSLVPSVLFTYLSLLPGHGAPSLRQAEVQLTIGLLRTKFSECLQIGRDLLRLLQTVSRIPEFTELWHDIINSPNKLTQNFTGIQSILNRRTSRRFLAGRIVTDAEIKLNFLLSKVKFGMHKKYQEWFQKKYLSNPDSLSLIPELVRFISCVIHPSNEVLGSDIMPRWALIGWLLSLCQHHPLIYANAKLALFYDWFSYTPDGDNIMNIEPAALLMFHSLRAHPQITNTLLEYLCKMIEEFCPLLENEIRSCITTAFEDIVEKGVLQSLEPLLCSAKLEEDVRTLLKNNFPTLCQKVGDVTDNNDEDAPLIIDTNDFLGNQDDGDVAAVFSDQDEQDTVLDHWAGISKLPPLLQNKLQQLRIESESLIILEETLQLVDEKYHSVDIFKLVSPPLTHCISDDFEISCTTDGSEPTRSYQCLLRVIENSSHLRPLLQCMREYQCKLGYFLLYYLKGSGDFTLYKDSIVEGETCQSTLVQDIKFCAEEENAVFFEMLPVLYSEFSEDLIGCAEVINIIVSHTDPEQLAHLVIQLTLKQITLLGKQHLQDVIVSSLQWDSFEQFSLWQLLCAESADTHHIIPHLRHINPEEHFEATSGAIMLLRNEPAIPGAVGNLLSLPVDSHDVLVVTVITRWINTKPNKMAKFIDYCLSKVLKINDPLLTLQSMLYHLENALVHINTTELFKGNDMALIITIDNIFTKYPALTSRCPKLEQTIKDMKVKFTADLKSSLKRRASLEDNEDIVRTKKRRPKVLEDCSD